MVDIFQAELATLTNQYGQLLTGSKVSTLIMYVQTVAITAGYLNRNNDPPPDYQKIWGGYIRLVNMSQAYELAIRRSKDGWLYERLSPD